MSTTRKTALIILGILGAFLLIAVIGIILLWAVFRRGEPTIHDNSLITLPTIRSKDSLAVRTNLSQA
jgi:hypothetical protein